MRHRFETLVRAFCEVEDDHWPDRLLEGESMELHGVEFSLLYEEDIAVDALHLRIVFGTAPLKNETAIYRALLKENHAGYCGDGPGFCVSPASGRVVYLLKMPLYDVSPAKLRSTMLTFIGKVKEWQSTYFLTPVARRD
ncbi:CesT family type III secretion system chaperone [Actimicrobium sp. CCI2.3]|uniref:CesT family type III secretion system chaperone n=1 Tax=Actimicrobium sp. CCI2.3 TaxID=3048616 RepID=UPI002AB4B505|nr:CesT family type III secretion system chaperone [Actimicrobium sp. CCI2.3]MDY7575729.1 CesT family type III secretion system chaperone [Actimicrobium sp. CCI2.3]MEB0023768.1 CesT family type III secretion system chaperone [Actimicrobium sp. CCI2.3]